MSAFTYDHPATFTTPVTRGSLRLFAYVNAKGRIVTDSDAGGWTMKTAKGIVDSAGDVHPLDNDAQTVADIITNEAGATVTAQEVRALWAILAMVG